MKYIALTATKAEVLDEVAKTTAYEGKKATGDEGAYERIFATDEDKSMLQRFWDEAASSITESMKRFVTTVNGDTYSAELEVSGSYDETLTSSINKSLFSYFVNAIVSKWNNFVKEGQVERYENEANAAMQDIMSKLFYKKKPTRVSV